MTVDPRQKAAKLLLLSEAKQQAYARQRFDYTTLFRAWFRAWSDYEATWHRIVCEPVTLEVADDVHRKGPTR